jgi:hypothetical protein
MEKSLENIEKSLSTNSISGKGKSASGGAGAANALSSMATSVNAITNALSAKNFKEKNADTVLNFITGLSSATNGVKPRNTEALAQLTSGITEFVNSMSGLSLEGLGKIVLFGETLFSGKSPLLEKIVNASNRIISTIKPVENVGSLNKLISSISNFIDLAASISEVNLDKMVAVTKTLFGGRYPLLEKIVKSASSTFSSLPTGKLADSKVLTEFVGNISKFVSSVSSLSEADLSKVETFGKTLFAGRNPLLQSIVSGATEALSSVKSLGNSKELVNFVSQISKFVSSVSSLTEANLAKVEAFGKMLFGGRNPLLQSIVSGATKALSSGKSLDNAKGLVNFATGISKFVNSLSSLSAAGLGKVEMFAKMMFGGKNSLLQVIVKGASEALGSAKSFGNAEGLIELAMGISKFISTMSSLSLMGIGKILIFGRVLFGGNAPLLQTIVKGASAAYEEASSIQINNGPVLIAMALDIVKFVKTLSSLSLTSLAKILPISKMLFEGKNPLLQTIIKSIATSSANAANIGTGGEMLVASAAGIVRFINSLSTLSLSSIGKIKMFGRVLFGGKKPLLQTIVEGISKSMNTISASDLKKLALAGDAIQLLSVGLSRLAKAMGNLALIAVVAPLVVVGAGVAWLVVKLFTLLGSNLKEIKRGGEGIYELGKGLAMLAGGLAMMALLVTVVPAETYFEAIAVIAGFSLAFALIGKAGESITKGAKGVERIGRALAGLAIGIALMSLVVLLVPPKVLLMGMLLVAGYGLIFALIGKASGEIADGALVMILGIALGLFFFSGALLLLAYTISKIGFANALMGIGLIGITAALFGLLGTFSPSIYAGAQAVGAIGVGMAVFGAGILVYALALKGVMALFKNNWETAAIATVSIIGGMALMFAGVGLMVPLIESGAAAIGSIGISIAIFGAGILLYSLALKGVMALFKNDWEIAAKATAGIILGLATMFSVAGLLIIPIALGAAAVALIGVSLVAFSVGLILFALTVKAVKAMGLLDKDNKFIGTDIIVSVMKGFAKAGWSAIPALFGAAAVVAVGASLLIFAAGLAATSKAMEKADPKMLKDKLFEPGKGIISVLITEFSKIGKSIGGFSMLFGVDNVSKGARAVKRISDALSGIAGGIVKFANVDNVPVQIADDKTGKLVYKNVSLDTTLKNLRTVMVGDDGKGGILLTMAKVFGEIGMMPEVSGVPNASDGSPRAGSFFGNLLRRISGDTPMLRGIRAVSQIGDTLSSLAGGVTAFANVDEVPVQYADSKGTLIYRNVSLSTILKNVETVMIGEDKKGGILLTLAKIFGDIGNMSEVTGIPDNVDGSHGAGSWFGNLWRKITGDTPMLRGIKAVAQIGDTLGSLAGGITAFANVDEIPISVPSADGKSLIYKSVKLTDVITNIKAALIGDGAGGKNPGLLFALANVFSTIGEMYPDGIIFDGPVQQGAKAVKDISESIGGIAQTVLAFGDLEKRVPVHFDKDGRPDQWEKIDQQSIRNNLVAFINLMPKTFADLDSDMLDDAQENAEKYKGVAEVIAQLASPMKTLREAFLPKGNQKDEKGVLSSIADEITGFVNFLSKNPIQDSVITSLNKLIDVFGRLGAVASPFKEFVKGFRDFQDPLAAFSTNIKNFTTNFTKFSSQLKNYEKFAGLLNSHALLAKQYTIFVPQFGQMSKDLEVFAKNFKVMDATAIEAFKIWTESLTNFVKTDPETFTNIADQLAKVINAPLTVQDMIDVYKKLAKGEEVNPAAEPATLTNDSGRSAIQSTVSRRKSEIEILQDQVSQLTNSVNSLVSVLTSENGIAVRVQQ